MKNLKEDNIQKSLWHIKRHCENIEKNTDVLRRKIELLHLKESVETLIRVYNDEKIIYQPTILKVQAVASR
ncbi:hypothetical protein NKE72_04680 [Streptococcus suis]|uniref:hypothetical protein n=1 Tax=Streptococcus suis TaxID=1307 RepID=UPI00209ABBD1|nr:hypothetical protein [Streptococcus suis]MCO8189145.1 hypothetical protein [Streptococcus suis]MCO8205559.1 hypothetical protein [Streptococcus suis]MCO8213415.1 hypothetical protein [Streptococcus suis]MCO8230990.1 hypothetical protein [Streptococcus suis]MCO8239297.1 hypothetical protein [Streptococcus suis]